MDPYHKAMVIHIQIPMAALQGYQFKVFDMETSFRSLILLIRSCHWQYWKQQPKLALGIDALSIWNCSAGVTFLASILQDHDAAYPDIWNSWTSFLGMSVTLPYVLSSWQRKIKSAFSLLFSIYSGLTFQKCCVGCIFGLCNRTKSCSIMRACSTVLFY